MNSLYPVFDAPTLYEQSMAQPAPQYGRGLAFDFERGDFVLDGAGRLVQTDGHAEWVQWCRATVQVERYSALVHGHRYGCELLAAAQMPSPAVAESAIIRAITEALRGDGRTREVRDFAFHRMGDRLGVAFVAVPTVGAAERLEVIVTL